MGRGCGVGFRLGVGSLGTGVRGLFQANRGGSRRRLLGNRFGSLRSGCRNGIRVDRRGRLRAHCIRHWCRLSGLGRLYGRQLHGFMERPAWARQQPTRGLEPGQSPQVMVVPHSYRPASHWPAAEAQPWLQLRPRWRWVAASRVSGLPSGLRPRASREAAVRGDRLGRGCGVEFGLGGGS